ncbi:MAG TPA: glycosyl hydrolase-related protein, partial [Candidatus Kryptonia bacterium]|nr:glycosyl hydrolase-related protein [Candidatus Kryptonia bacterium]
QQIPLAVTTWVRIAPGVPRIDLTVRVDNSARDHRVRLLFPTGGPVSRFLAASTFDVATRSTARPDDSGWVHRAPTTFAHHGWVSANGLMVVAPGLPEGEVTPEGVIALTLLRAVGWLARYDLRSRPVPAGPPMAVSGAQLPGPIEARLSLLAEGDCVAAHDAELGLRGVIAGAAPLLAAQQSLLTIEPRELLLSALKPAEDGDGIVLRLLNPTDVGLSATLHVGFPLRSACAVRLDEGPVDCLITIEANTVRCEVPPRALRSLRLR